MKTTDLIRTMAADAVQPWRPGRLLLAGLIPSLAAGLVLLWITLGFRVDLATSLVTPISAVRIVLSAGLGLAALRIAFQLARPDGRASARLWPLALVGAVALGLWVWTCAATPVDARQMAIAGKTLEYCLTFIPVMSILPVASILCMLRRGATTRPGLAGFAAGLAGSGLAASIYALHCTEDSPLFYVTWYSVAILGVTLVSTLLGKRILRW